MEPITTPPGGITLRTTLRSGDLGTIVYLHGVLYARESGFDPTFEAYVAGPLAEFVRSASDRERLWIAERDGQIIGCVAIVAVAAEIAQLRWFLVDPSARGQGLGKLLLRQAILFCKDCGYKSVVLWTESSLETAAHLYQSVGFRRVEEKPGRMWGRKVVEEKYQLDLG
jgi:N-acetylglutamate synthase-like GNAT family acetyltransferase